MGPLISDNHGNYLRELEIRCNNHYVLRARVCRAFNIDPLREEIKVIVAQKPFKA